MSKRNRKWYWLAFKALVVTGIFYRFARFFLKAASKQSSMDGNKEKRQKK